jgi:hypothetical protein
MPTKVLDPSSPLEEGVRLGNGFAEVLESAASRIYACFSKLGDLPEQDEGLVREMVRLAFNFDVERVRHYLEKMSNTPQDLAGHHVRPHAFV